MGIETVFKSNVAECQRKIDQAAKSKMEEATQKVRNQVLETLSGGRSGRVYKVPGSQKTYRASSPGPPPEAPAQATGRLRQSIKSGTEDNGRTGYVGTDLDYGRMLEFGTRKIEPRPWLRKSFEEVDIKEIFTRLWFL